MAPRRRVGPRPRRPRVGRLDRDGGPARGAGHRGRRSRRLGRPARAGGAPVWGPPREWPRMVMTSSDAPARLAAFAPEVASLAGSDAGRGGDLLGRRNPARGVAGLGRGGVPGQPASAVGRPAAHRRRRGGVRPRGRPARAGRAAGARGTALDGALALGRHLARGAPAGRAVAVPAGRVSAVVRPARRDTEPASSADGAGSGLAEDRGFEPLRAFTQHAFQACALGHYANPPSRRLPEGRTHRIRRIGPARAAGCAGRISALPRGSTRWADPPRGGTSLNSPRAGMQQGQVSSSRYVGGPCLRMSARRTACRWRSRVAT